ncbi:MAG: substrate-binding domain-containing protein [Chloroflexi bacterium]|nr:substrate-binding domain-containing protein [Chloroflexota bacterium]
MNLAKRLRVSIAFALALTMSVSGVAYAADPTIDHSAFGKIEGSGATFPWNQYTDWFRSFTDENTEATAVTSGTSLAQFHPSSSTSSLVLGYNGGGSSTGIANFWGSSRKTATQMFSGTDAPPTAAQRTSIEGVVDIKTNYSVIPAITGPLSVVYRIDGLKTKTGASATLRLDGPTVCGIYLGTIQKWNDTAIKALNPSVANLPNSVISVVGRSDGSGTTFVFTSYLAKAASAAQKNCGYHSNFTSSTEANLNDAVGTFLPAQTAPGTYYSAIRAANGATAITGKPGNGGIAPYIKATNLTISYVESSYASKYGLKEAALAAKTKRGATTVYLKPTSATVQSALDNEVLTGSPINPTTSFVQPVFAAGVNSYPIVGYSWWMIYHEYNNGSTTLGQVQGMIAFMNWALTEGQTSTYLYKGYAAVPQTARTAAIAELHKVKFGGAVVWP